MWLKVFLNRGGGVIAGSVCAGTERGGGVIPKSTCAGTEEAADASSSSVATDCADTEPEKVVNIAMLTITDSAKLRRANNLTGIFILMCISQSLSGTKAGQTVVKYTKIRALYNGNQR